MERYVRTIIRILALASLAGIGCLISWNRGMRAGRDYQHALDLLSIRPDTTVIHDTAWFDRPVPRLVEVVDSFYVPADTVRIHDTLFIALPLERKIYEDSLFYAVVSGYQPSLDEIRIFQPTKVITQTRTVKEKVRQRNSLGVDMTVLSDSGFRLPFTVCYSHRWDKGFVFGGGAGYDLLTSSPVVELKAGMEFRW